VLNIVICQNRLTKNQQPTKKKNPSEAKGEGSKKMVQGAKAGGAMVPGPMKAARIASGGIFHKGGN